MIWPSSSCTLWPPSPKHRHDHHRHRLDTLISIEASLSSHQLLLLWQSLPLSDKVNQLHGDCISYNKATTIWLLPVADNCVTKHDHLIQKNLASCLDHITSQHALQKQVRRPLLCCCKFYVAATGLARTVLTYALKPQRGIVIAFWSSERTIFIESDSTKVGESHTHQPPVCEACR